MLFLCVDFFLFFGFLWFFVYLRRFCFFEEDSEEI